MPTPPANPELREASTGELVKQLTDDMRTLVQKEVALAKAELSEKGKRAGVGAGLLGGGATFGFLALATIVAAIVGLLDRAMAFWVAALIVGVVLAAVAAVMAMTGKNKVQEAGPPVPEETVESVKEDVQWLKTRS